MNCILMRIVFICLVSFSLPAWLLAAPMAVPAAPQLQAKSYFLADFNSGKILAERNADERVEPASITKVMTAYVVYKALEGGTLSIEDTVLISEKAWRMGGSKMFVEVNQQIPMAKLLEGLIVQSGNDAAVALAEHVAGSEAGFVTLMNAEAARLDMKGTHFTNVTGWPDAEHYMTARDIYLMAAAMIRDFPEHYKRYSQKSFEYGGIKQDNRNRLLWLDGTVDGMKTGHTEAAGYCLVSSAQREGMRLISVVLGASSDGERTSQSRTLLNYGFRFYETRKLYSAGDEVATAKVWKGDESVVRLGLQQDFHITFPRGQYDRLDAKLDRQRTIEAPLETGALLGNMNVMLGTELMDTRPLVALTAVEEGGFLRRALDGIKLFLE